MSDDPFFATNHKPERRQPKHGQRLWETRLNHATWSAELRFHGESWGWEAQIFKHGEFVIGRRFVTRILAVGWAEEERTALEQSAGVPVMNRPLASTAGLCEDCRHAAIVTS